MRLSSIRNCLEPALSGRAYGLPTRRRLTVLPFVRNCFLSPWINANTRENCPPRSSPPSRPSHFRLDVGPPRGIMAPTLMRNGPDQQPIVPCPRGARQPITQQSKMDAVYGT
jgi:hypothetical protein